MSILDIIYIFIYVYIYDTKFNPNDVSNIA